MDPSSATPGLRARKKQKTRDTISNVALELFDEQGYEHTTIAEIADAAEVSPRTIFAYFPSKEDILFCDLPEIEERLAQAFRERPEDTTALDALREFILESLTPDKNRVLRKRIVASNDALRRNERARFAPLERLTIDAIAQDLNAGPDDIRPRIVAAAVIAAFDAVSDGAAPPLSEAALRQHATEVIDEVMGFLRGGLEALRNQ
jgi:AcrR family transcriptional regulator